MRWVGWACAASRIVIVDRYILPVGHGQQGICCVILLLQLWQIGRRQVQILWHRGTLALGTRRIGYHHRVYHRIGSLLLWWIEYRRVGQCRVRLNYTWLPRLGIHYRRRGQVGNR